MNNPLFAIAATLALLAASASAITVPATEDTYSLAGKITARSGKATTLPISATKKAFAKFDLASLPTGVNPSYVIGARVRVYLVSVKLANTLVQVSSVTSAWQEDPALAAAEPTLDPTAITTLTVSKAKRFIYVDVTGEVIGWLNDPTTNHGLAFTSLGTLALGSKEGSGVGYPAELEVDMDLAALAVSGSGQVNGSSIVSGSVTGTQLGSNLTLAGTTIGMFSGSGSALTNLAAANVTGQLTGAQLADGAVTPIKSSPDCAVFYEELPYNQNASASIAGWQLRNLNSGTTVGTSVTRVGNTITLAPGTYFIAAEAVAGGSDHHQLILRDLNTSGTGNPTPASAVIRGLTSFTNSSTATVTTPSALKGIIAVSDAARSFELWHYTETASTKFAGATNNPDQIPNRYTEIAIIRLK